MFSVDGLCIDPVCRWIACARRFRSRLAVILPERRTGRRKRYEKPSGYLLDFLKPASYACPQAEFPKIPHSNSHPSSPSLDCPEKTTVLPDCQKEPEPPPTPVSFSRSP